MKAFAGLLAALVGMMIVAYLGSKLSADAVGMAVGILLGVLAGIPVSLIVLASSRGRRRDEEEEYERREQARMTSRYGDGPVIVIPPYLPSNMQGPYPPNRQITGNGWSEPQGGQQYNGQRDWEGGEDDQW